MKKHWILWCCATGLLLVPLRAEEEKHTKLGEQMEAMDDAFKAFRRETDPAKGAVHAREAQDAAIKGLSEVPDMLKSMPDGPEKTKALAEYRKMMGKLLVTLCEIEGEFLTGKTDGVAKLVDAVKEQKKAGHDKFIEEKDE